MTKMQTFFSFLFLLNSYYLKKLFLYILFFWFLLFFLLLDSFVYCHHFFHWTCILYAQHLDIAQTIQKN